MKRRILGITVVAASTIAAPALAECPANLTAEQRMECIVTEGAGYFYTPTSNQTIVQPATTESGNKK